MIEPEGYTIEGRRSCALLGLLQWKRILCLLLALSADPICGWRWCEL